MSSILAIALNGLQAAVHRLSVSAHNVAHATVAAPVAPSGIAPKASVLPRAVQSSPEADVGVDVRLRSQPALAVPDRSSGMELSAGVGGDLVAEAVEQRAALASYRSNLAALPFSANWTGACSTSSPDRGFVGASSRAR